MGLFGKKKPAYTRHSRHGSLGPRYGHLWFDQEHYNKIELIALRQGITIAAAASALIDAGTGPFLQAVFAEEDRKAEARRQQGLRVISSRASQRMQRETQRSLENRRGTSG